MTISKRFHQTGTKYLESHFKGAPKLENTYGSLNNLLKKVLTESYNITIASSIEVLEETLKITVALNHGFIANQVISLVDHTEAQINKEYRIIESYPTYITVAKPVESVLTDSYNSNFTIKGVPLGYTIPYENEEEGVICFKNKSLKSPAILKSIDKLPPNGYLETWSKYARVTAGSAINSAGNFINNFKTPYHPGYPDCEKTGNGVSGAGGVHGFAKWTYSLGSGTSPKETDTPKQNITLNWILIGDDTSFYLMINTTGVLDNTSYGCDLVGFGNYHSFNDKESFNVCLQAKDGYIEANSSTLSAPSRPRSFFGSLDSECSGFILADAYGAHETNYGRVKSYGNYISSNNLKIPWDSSHIKLPSSGGYLYDRVLIKDYYNFLRGQYRGISILYGNSLPDRYILENKISIQVQQPTTTTTLSKASMLFDLTDWEKIP